MKMFSTKRTVSIKRTLFKIFKKFLLNVPYDLKNGHDLLNVLVSIISTGWSYKLIFIDK